MNPPTDPPATAKVRQTTWTLGLITLLCMAGCEPKDQQQILDEGQAAASHAGKALKTMWESTVSEARKLDTKSNRDQLEKAKKDLEGFEQQLQQGAKSSADAVRSQVERLNAAEKLKDLQSQMDEKLKEADRARQEVSDGISNAKEHLDSANKAYDAVQEKVKEAQQVYDDAAKRAQDAWNVVTR